MSINTMPNVFISESGVLKKLKELKLDKSPGTDMLHPRVLHETREKLTPYLTNLFNESLHQGLVPNDWKHSTITVIYKKGKKNNVENYRPISLTCVCCKIMESIIRDHIMSYFISNKLFSDKQYGFIKGRTAVLQLLRVVDDWTKLLDQGKQIDIIYTDFEKAFDKVPHRRLLSKLLSYGLNSELINWIESFLQGRTQCVKINNKISSSKPVLSGIPQGSVLGPLLFVIFINDLPDACTNLSELFLFADDAKLYKCIQTQNDSDVLNKCFQNILSWSDDWLMKLNINKCKVLSLCGSRSKFDSYQYGSEASNNIHTELQHVDNIKDLGVTMDSEMLFNNHVYDKINIAYKMLGIVKRNFKEVDKSTFLVLYKSFVRSHLEYANSVWSAYRIGIIKDIEKVQKRATKCVQGCSGMCYKDRLMYLQLPTLNYRRLRGSMIEVYKTLNGFYSEAVAPILPRNLDTRTRGNSLKLIVNHCKHDIRKFSFCNRVTYFWNKLPNTVVNSSSLNLFKNSLDKYCVDENIYYDTDCHCLEFGS